jgi:hypothetical protein
MTPRSKTHESKPPQATRKALDKNSPKLNSGTPKSRVQSQPPSISNPRITNPLFLQNPKVAHMLRTASKSFKDMPTLTIKQIDRLKDQSTRNKFFYSKLIVNPGRRSPIKKIKNINENNILYTTDDIAIIENTLVRIKASNTTINEKIFLIPLNPIVNGETIKDGSII